MSIRLGSLALAIWFGWLAAFFWGDSSIFDVISLLLCGWHLGRFVDSCEAVADRGSL